MKKLFLALLLSFSAQAVELKFIGPCDEEFIMKVEVSDEFTNVGELTVETLKKFSIPFKGSAEGLSSAFETDQVTETVSSTEIRAHGWCFSVDGVSPESYPHEVAITPETKSVIWHYGFAQNVNGQWVSQCTPTWTVKPDFLCKDPTVGDAP